MRHDFELVDSAARFRRNLWSFHPPPHLEVGVSLRQINACGSGSINITRMTHADDPSVLVVEPLQRTQLRSVFILMRFALPNLALREWLRFARPLTVGEGLASRGVLVVRRAPHRHPLGAAYFRRHVELNQPGVLTVETIVTIDHFSGAALLEALLEGVIRAAARLECATVRVMADGSNEMLASVLLKAGHSLVGATFVRPI